MRVPCIGTRAGKAGLAAAVLFSALAVGVRADGDEDAADRRAEAGAMTAAILAVEADPAYGDYLAGECVTCHRRSGDSDGIPPIAGKPVEYIVGAMVEYRLAIRPNEVMVMRARRLGDEEIAALAAHFAAQSN